MKLRSSLTLFIEAGGGSMFGAALRRWFHGEPAQSTRTLLNAAQST
ncbi:MAG TPA: DUF1810 family protein [Sphingomicrobium sp.]|nr:DUF1810 family protein [Sphingomicrobium sp.]